MNRISLLAILLVTVSLGFKEGEHTGTVQSTRLYTPFDPSAGGGISARIVNPQKPIVAVFAMPSDNPKFVYKGSIIGSSREIRFKGLPVGKYDLMILYEDEFYEGFTLTRDGDALTTRDRDSIKAAIMRTVPFFDTKQIHRLAGGTGREARGRCVLQEVRTKTILTQNADVMTGMQVRSIKIAMVEDVGATGWTLKQSRELVRQEVASNERKGILGHHYQAKLGGIRVTDAVKELGELNLFL